MRYLILFFVCFILCGCGTFTATQIDNLQRAYFYAGCDAGYKEGFKVGEIFGHIDEIKYQSDRLMKDAK